MSEKTEKRRAALRERIIDAAAAVVTEHGVQAVRARDLAKEAGCAVGAIYTVFDDLTAIFLALNGRTFAALGKAVSAALAARPDAPPGDALMIMARAYLGFASKNRRAWRTLFDVEMALNSEVPQWYLDDMNALFALIAKPLREINPDQSDEEINLLTRALFSSVHGIVLLGLERRVSGVPLSEIERMIETVLRPFGEKI